MTLTPPLNRGVEAGYMIIIQTCFSRSDRTTAHIHADADMGSRFRRRIRIFEVIGVLLAPMWVRAPAVVSAAALPGALRTPTRNSALLP